MKWGAIKQFAVDRWRDIKKIPDVWQTAKTIAKNPLVQAAWSGAKSLVPQLGLVEQGLAAADKVISKIQDPLKAVEGIAERMQASRNKPKPAPDLPNPFED